MPRIIAGKWKGRVLAAPPGEATRPTAERLRQSLFDMLWHAEWGGREWLEGVRVLDAFAGTGALGIEALSRGAAGAVFFERDRAALAVLRANLAGCGGAGVVMAADAVKPPPMMGGACGLVFLDPPYGLGLVPAAVAALEAAGWLGEAAVLVAEHGKAEPVSIAGWAVLASRVQGAGGVTVFDRDGRRAG